MSGDLSHALALTIWCPTCSAASGEKCRTPRGRVTRHLHAARRRIGDYVQGWVTVARIVALLQNPEAAAAVIAAHAHE